MKTLILSLCLALAVPLAAPLAAAAETPPAPATRSALDQQLIDLSAQKWQWMSERNVAALDTLFDANAVFVHMGGTMPKAQELEVIRSGGIQYKKADVEDVSVRFIGDTAIVLSKIRLLAVVGGNEVTNPFMVTEVYVKQSGAWKLASLSFTRLLGQ